MTWHGKGMVCHVMAWHGMVWHGRGMVWYGMS